MRSLPILLLLALLPPTASGQVCGDSFVEGFTAFSNVGAWGWDGIFQANLGSGGNPGAWLRSSKLQIEAPSLRSQDALSPFGGDWRAAGVSSVGVDLFAVDLDPAQCARPVSLVLWNDAGTPGTPVDDRAVVFVGTDPIPCKDGDWHSYAVDVPSQSPSLPSGWTIGAPGGLPPDQVWNAVIQDVTTLRWQLGDPAATYPITTWILGADNPRIAYGAGPTTYCSAQNNSLGCSPALTWAGIPSASLPSPFFVHAHQLDVGVPGIFFYGPTQAALPLLGGTVCVGPPFLRLPVQVSSGPAGGCNGFLVIDFNAHAQSGSDPALVAGALVHLQAWSRDPGSPGGSSLPNAVRFTLCP